MDASNWASLISTIGFPIAACCAIFYMMNKEREDHKNEITTLKDVISNISTRFIPVASLVRIQSPLPEIQALAYHMRVLLYRIGINRKSDKSFKEG